MVNMRWYDVKRDWVLVCVRVLIYICLAVVYVCRYVCTHLLYRCPIESVIMLLVWGLVHIGLPSIGQDKKHS